MMDKTKYVSPIPSVPIKSIKRTLDTDDKKNEKKKIKKDDNNDDVQIGRYIPNVKYDEKGDDIIEKSKKEINTTGFTDFSSW